MTCDEALDRMLEADPGELTEDLDEIDAREMTELTVHIRSCGRCAAVARTLRSELRSLDTGLEALAHDPARSAGSSSGAADAADAAADAALAAVRSDANSEVVALHRSDDNGAKERPRWARRAWIPLAAAAALTGVLVIGQREQPLPPSDATARTEAIDPRVSVVPPADRGAAIMETGNPNITIVWLYEREES